MVIDNKVIFVSGANRGIGRAIVEALLKKTVKKVYATARKLEDLPKFNDPRVVPIQLDITNDVQIKKAANEARDVNVLINNAGALSFASVIFGEESQLKHDMQVNYFGTLNMVRAFVPVIQTNGVGAIANISSVVGLASMSAIGGYSASKAALFSASQAMRAELKSKNITVHTIFPGPIDTDMAKGFEMNKTSPTVAAENIVQGIIAGDEDIFPDPMAVGIGSTWSKDPKSLERSFAGM